jgi:nucleoside-diphosphate-sugar epimerase
MTQGRLPVYADPYRGERVAVLGATGFIGRWVAAELHAAGAKLILPVRDRVAAATVLSDCGFDGEVSTLDLADEAAVRSFFSDARPTVTFNLAGYGVDRGETDEEAAFQINTRLVQVIAEAIAASPYDGWRGQRLIHAGTAMEYGAVAGDLVEDGPTMPTTLYGRSKLAGTEALAHVCKESGLRGLTARLFAVYGPGESESRLLPSLRRAAVDGSSIELTAGLHKRDFVYIGDVGEGLLRLGTASVKPGEIVNLASGRLTSIREFAETAADRLGIDRSKLLFGALPTRAEEMRHHAVSNRRLLDSTGWQPTTTVREGIERSIADEMAISM